MISQSLWECLAGTFWIRAYLVVLLGGLECPLLSSPAAALALEREEFKQDIATDPAVKRLIKVFRKQEHCLQKKHVEQAAMPLTLADIGFILTYPVIATLCLPQGGHFRKRTCFS